MKNFFRVKNSCEDEPTRETSSTKDAPVPMAQPHLPIAEAIPLEIQKRMLRNIRRSLHNKSTDYPR